MVDDGGLFAGKVNDLAILGVKVLDLAEIAQFYLSVLVVAQVEFLVQASDVHDVFNFLIESAVGLDVDEGQRQWFGWFVFGVEE